MSQNGKRKASLEGLQVEGLQEQPHKRQRLGELGHPGIGTSTTVSANTTGHPATTFTTMPANVTGHSNTTFYGSIAGQATIGGQTSIAQAPRGHTVDNAAGVGGAVDSNNDAQGARQTNSTGAKRKRRACSPTSDEPSSKQSARGQKRAGLHEAGLNDKEKGAVQRMEGQLYCMHPVDKKWVPAVFHSAIRADLIVAASARGSYSVERARGALENDVTSYLECQSDWSGERQHWPRIRHDILNRHERNGWRDEYHGRRAQVWIHVDGRIVIDHDRNPMYRHPDLPDTLSSAIEGWYLEAVMRLDSRILRETIRARLPDSRRPPKSRKVETESMYALTAISNKRLRFRHNEGLVAWDSRAVSTEMNNYFRSFIPQASLDRNTNEGGRGLSKAERDHGESLGKGKKDGKKKRGTTSSSTATPDQTNALTPVTMESEPAAQAQALHAGFDGSILSRASDLASPSPLVQANGRLLNPYHQARPAVDPSQFPFLPGGGFNPYQTSRFEPTRSASSQGNAVAHTASMGLTPPAHLNGTDLAGFSSSSPYQPVSQPQRTFQPQHLEQPRGEVSTNISNSAPGQTNGRTARTGGSRRGRARWRNDDPPVYDDAATRPSGGISAGGRSHNLEDSSKPNGALSHSQTTSVPKNAFNGESGRPSGQLADNLRLGSHPVNPESTNSTGNGRARGFVQQSENLALGAPAKDFDRPLIEDGQWSLSGENPFGSHDGWPTALDLELFDLSQLANNNVDENDSGNGLETTRNDIAGPSSTTGVYYDDSAPLQGGQENSVWILDDNGNWVLDGVPGETIQDQAVIASNNTANRLPQAETDQESLAATSTSPQLYQTGEIGINIGETPVPTAFFSHHPAQPTPSPTAIDQPSMAENSTTQQAAPADNESAPSRDIPSTSGNENTQPAEDDGARYAIPTNNFQYATIQTLLAPTRMAFIAAFQDESWRIYVPLNFVPPTDRHSSYQEVFERLSMDFWDIWTSRYGVDAQVPLLAPPSLIDEFSAAVLLGLPG